MTIAINIFRRLRLAALAAFACCAAPVWACNVPVFRYALERWEQDPYPLAVFFRSAVSSSENTAMGMVRAFEERHGSELALAPVLVNVNEAMPDALSQTWAQVKSQPLPYTALLYPEILRLTQTVWTGPLDERTWKEIVYSPAREEMAARLRRGDATVWLVLLSGDKAADDRVVNILSNECRKLEATLRLPEEFQYAPGTPGDVKIKFSTMTLDRTNAAEALLRAMLTRVDPAIGKETKPLVFPVFGRGRALCVLTSDDITPERMADVAQFLIGACSCQVKEQNPGFDLLLAAPWNEGLYRHPVDDTALPPLEGFGGPAVSGVVQTPWGGAPALASNTALAAPAVPGGGAERSLWRNTVVVVGAAGIGVAIATSFMLNRPRRPRS